MLLTYQKIKVKDQIITSIPKVLYFPQGNYKTKIYFLLHFQAFISKVKNIYFKLPMARRRMDIIYTSKIHSLKC